MSVFDRNRMCAGTPATGTRWRTHASTRSSGTLPWVSSPASSAAALAAFNAETNRSALANALRDATAVRVTELPLLRDRVWRAPDRHSGSRRPTGSP